MGELLNREYQYGVLRQLADTYPEPCPVHQVWGPQEDNTLRVNLYYMRNHGLIEFVEHGDKDSPKPLPIEVTINAAGLDFMSQDGGLQAVLNTVIIRFDDEQMLQILEVLVGKATGSDDQKARIMDHLKDIPASMIANVVEKLSMQGVEGAYEYMQKLIGSSNL